MLVDLGNILVLNETIDGETHIKLVINCRPYLDDKYDTLEGVGETFAEALANLLEEVEGVPE